MIKAVVFDYGGTLVHSARPWNKVRPRALLSAYHYLKRRGLRLSYREYLAINEALFGSYAEREASEQIDIPDRVKYLDLVGRLYPGITKTKKLALATGANDSFWHVVNGNFELRDDAKTCLDQLENMGIKLGLISNHHDGSALMRSMRPYRIMHRFNPIVISEEVKVRKPDPAIFRLCLSAMKVRPRQAVYVGDVREFDVAGAKAAGMYSILIGNKGGDGPSPDFAVKGMDEIPQIVASLNERKSGHDSAAAAGKPRHPKSSLSRARTAGP
jgi:HAD superfamily hydrolase (TIGR01549 family)